MYNSNTCIGYKLVFYRYKYSSNMHDSYTASMKIINGQNLYVDKIFTITIIFMFSLLFFFF